MNPDQNTTCTTCEGTGRILRQKLPDFPSQGTIRCPRCLGTAKVPRSGERRQARRLENELDWDSILESIDSPKLPPPDPPPRQNPAKPTEASPFVRLTDWKGYSLADPPTRPRHSRRRRFLPRFRLRLHRPHLHPIRRHWYLISLVLLVLLSLSPPSQVWRDLNYIIEERTLPRASYVSGVACSGSMEPTLTCLDEVRVVTEFRSEEIAVGDIIMFVSPDQPRNEEALVIHRVVEVSQRSNRHFYSTAGDASPVADDWLVPEDLVRGYISEIHKDVRMENTHKRQQGLIERMRRYGY